MPVKHGVYVSEVPTAVTVPIVADCGIPFVIGAAPVHLAENPAASEVPVLVTSWEEFVAKLGYSEDWGAYNLCEFAYSHFKLYGRQPAIFCNMLKPATHKSAVTAADKAVADHAVSLQEEAIPSSIVVKAEGGDGNAYVLNTDYTVTAGEGEVLIELLSTSTHFDEDTLNIAYDKVTPASITANTVATGLEAIELCMSTVGIIPDLIVSPGYSTDSTVAALMATKAAALNGIFRGKAVIDIDCSAVGGADSYDEAYAWKQSHNFVDDDQILCWPMIKLGDRIFHMSSQCAGLMARIDAENGCPMESPSNKNFQMDALCLADGTEILQTKAQADVLNSGGIVTALNFLSSGWVCWGNYCACYPGISDVKDMFIPVSRMFDWIGNTVIRTFWQKLDKPMNRRLIDNVLDTCNIWLNGLVGAGKLIGARAELLESENPITDLMAGIMKVHLYITPASPAQEIDFLLEYDISYLTNLYGNEEV